MLTLEDAQRITKTTVKQSSDPHWFAARRFRLTASNFGLVLNRKRQPSNAFLRNLFEPKDLSNVSSIRHGKTNESTARSLYAQTMQKETRKFTVYEAGLVVNPSHPFLGASPDGKVFDPSERNPFGLIEIKVPFRWRSNTFAEACQDHDFMCEMVEQKSTIRQAITPRFKVSKLYLDYCVVIL